MHLQYSHCTVIAIILSIIGIVIIANIEVLIILLDKKYYINKNIGKTINSILKNIN
jgi:hypothetical protein